MLSGRVFACWLAALLVVHTAARAQVIIPEQTLERHGLTRAWRVQIELNRAVDRIAYITQYKGALYVQSEHAFVHALDAETGKKIWASQIGKMSQVSMAPGVNDNYLAVINGSTLHVLDRATGVEKFQRLMVGAPGTGPALSDSTVFVCMVNGMIQGFHLEDQHALPWTFHAAGRILTQPVLSDANLAWTTDRGYFYVATADPPKIRLRVETQAEISSRPAHWTPYLYACSQSGFLYAVNEETGETAWKFPAGASLSTQPAAVNGKVYIVSDMDDLFSVDGKTGEQNWAVKGIRRVCSASASHIYAIDRFNRMVILDLRRGTPLSTFPVGDVQIQLLNQQTDRIYLASETGVLQCLREINQRTPLVYTPPAPKAKPGEKGKGAPTTTPSGEEDAESGDAAEKPADEMGADEEMPADGEKSEDSEDPFG